jgi:hypothetical protein
VDEAIAAATPDQVNAAPPCQYDLHHLSVRDL